MFQPIAPSGTLQDQYELLRSQMNGLIEANVPITTNLANFVALLGFSLPEINWVGVYLTEGDTLYLGPFQGLPACTTIAIGKGVCGTAAATRVTMNVKDVHQFDGHIACDSASNSELVIPLIKEGQLIGVLDIDSPVFDRFQPLDQQYLEEITQAMLKKL
jgi:L-methionine (R)-S-oxide reductase